MYGDKYRMCPLCRNKLSELMERKENGVNWEVYTCKTCGSEVWIDPFKELRLRYAKMYSKRFGR